MDIRYIAVRIDENEWNGEVFNSAREAYNHIKNRSSVESRPVNDYFIKLIEIESII